MVSLWVWFWRRYYRNYVSHRCQYVFINLTNPSLTTQMQTSMYSTSVLFQRAKVALKLICQVVEVLACMHQRVDFRPHILKFMFWLVNKYFAVSNSVLFLLFKSAFTGQAALNQGWIIMFGLRVFYHVTICLTWELERCLGSIKHMHESVCTGRHFCCGTRSFFVEFAFNKDQ